MDLWELEFGVWFFLRLGFRVCGFGVLSWRLQVFRAWGLGVLEGKEEKMRSTAVRV